MMIYGHLEFPRCPRWILRFSKLFWQFWYACQRCITQFPKNLHIAIEWLPIWWFQSILLNQYILIHWSPKGLTPWFSFFYWFDTIYVGTHTHIHTHTLTHTHTHTNIHTYTPHTHHTHTHTHKHTHKHILIVLRLSKLLRSKYNLVRAFNIV